MAQAQRVYRNATLMLNRASLDPESREYYSAVAASALSILMFGDR